VRRLAGRLIAVEGIDQAGKQTVCERLAARLRADGVSVALAGFPDYATPLGREIAAFLAGERDYPPEARQLLYAANRWERAAELRAWLAGGRAVVVDRYVASGIAYGTAQGLDPAWMREVERGLPAADLTLLLDITPEVSRARKVTARDAYEARTELLARARTAYLELAQEPGWRVVDASGDKEAVWSAVLAAIEVH
jgi:dTMP kinase